MDCPRIEFGEYEVLVINSHPLRMFLPRKGLKNQISLNLHILKVHCPAGPGPGPECLMKGYCLIFLIIIHGIICVGVRDNRLDRYHH